MTYLVNAWLERPQPCLQIINSENGAICVDFPPAVIEELRRDGEICAQDFCSNSPLSIKEIAHSLFHIAARYGCRLDHPARQGQA